MLKEEKLKEERSKQEASKKETSKQEREKMENGKVETGKPKSTGKTAILRGLFGIPVGISIGYLITVISSLIWGGGSYAPCVPELTERLGSQIQAVLLQTVLCALLGAVCAAASVFWEIEHWSITKQTILYFLAISIVMLPTAYLLYWMEHSLAGFLGYFGIFVLIFFSIWISQYLIALRNVRQINRKLK